MNKSTVLEWARANCGSALDPVMAELSAQVAALASATGEGAFLIDYFEAAVNSEDLFSRVKLVHVAKPLADAPARRRRELSLRRRAVLEGILSRARGFEAAALGRMYSAVFGAGIDDFYPVASVEWDLRARRFDEMSLYCDERAPEVAHALARGGERGELAPSRLSAVGYDFRPGKPARLKLYHRLATGRAALLEHPAGGPLAAIPERHLEAEGLTLRRREEGGSFQSTRKIYLSYLQRKSAASACTVEALADACAPGELKRFLGAIRTAARGQYLDYLGCENGRFEAYFGRPAWGFVEIAPHAGTGDRPGDLP